MSLLWELWRETSGRCSKRAAILVSSDGSAYSFDDLAARVAEKRLGRTAIVGVSAGDPVEFVVTFLAAMRDGRVFLPFDRGLDVDARERTLSILGSRPLPPGTSVLKLSSGSTGNPKGIALTERNLLAGVRSIVGTMEIGAADLNLAAISLAHSYGFDNLVMPLIVQGTPMVVLGSFFPRATLDAIAEYRPTIVPLVPFMYSSLLGLPGNWASVRTCISAGAMLPQQVAARFHESFGRKIHAFYGSSECGGITYDRSGAPFLAPGCVGTPMEGVRIDLTDEGRVWVSSEAVGLGYVPEGDNAVLGSGSFLTGDLARRDADGCLVLTGRAGEGLNVAGKKVHPSEIEACLVSLAGVRAAAVVGLPDPTRGDAIGALVVAEGIDDAGLLAHCRATLEPWKVPRVIRLVESLPYDERGKISRDAARDLLRTAERER